MTLARTMALAFALSGRGTRSRGRPLPRRRVPGLVAPSIQFLFEERNVTAIGHELLDTDTTESMDSETAGRV